MGAQNANDLTDREIVIERVFDAPRELVILEFGAIEGAKQTFARLAGYLKHMLGGGYE